jgi:acyl transferase domain-containing protein/acyl carrier protein
MSSGGHEFGIAIVGMAGRFPGAAGIEELWSNLRAGVESIRFFSAEELRAAGVDPRMLADPSVVPAGSELDGIDLFDAGLFGIGRREAEIMDPQHRLFLECAWTALEHAGCDPGAFPGPIGVYGGVSYQPYVWQSFLLGDRRELDEHLARLSLGTSLATRVSYKLDLHGPSLCVQTGCSTSLVAVHLACQGLLGYECDLALAGGVSIELRQKGYLGQTGILSPDGHCRTFDARAGGVVGGSGVGVVALKRLADAVEQGDFIYATLLGSAINNDGARKVGYAAPSVAGQKEVILAALAAADVEPDTLGYVEAHGTATALGDAIEIQALTQAFRTRTQRRGFCAIGSLKTNVGHLDNAAGVSGLIKTALALKRELIPASLHFERPNPELGLEASPFYVPTRATPWPAGGELRRAAVSAFGIGGTNAHVVLEEAPIIAPGGPSRQWQILTLSAKTESALAAVAENLAAHLESHPEQELADVAFTLKVGRRPLEHRRAVLCRDRQEAVTALREKGKPAFTAVRPPAECAVAFLFPGGGSQYAGMARGLYASEPDFRAELDRSARFAARELGIDLIAGLGEGTRPALALPAVFALEVALARLWMAWGVVPQALLGHSFGEYAAACVAGVFSLEDGLRLIAERGRLLESLPEGAMVTVPLSAADLADDLAAGAGDLSLAADNGPGRCVVSGTLAAVAAFEARLAARRVKFRTVRSGRAGHSRMVEPVLAPFAEFLRQVPLAAAEIPILSNVTGTWLAAAEATDPAYWAQQLRSTVRFGPAVAELWRDPRRVLLEVGPGRSLTALARRQMASRETQAALSTLPDAEEGLADQESLLQAVARLWLAGAEPDWTAFHRHERRLRMPLPTYPFERRRYWLQPAARETAAGGLPPAPPASGLSVPAWRRSSGSRRAAGPGESGLSLFLVGPAGPAAAAADVLESAGHEVVRVFAAGRFERLGERLFQLDPGSPGDLRSLFAELRVASRPVPSRVVYGWGVDEACPGFEPLPLLAGELARQAASALSVWILSVELQEVTGDEEPRPVAASLLGVAAGLPAGVAWRSLDLAAQPAPDGRLAARIAGELLAPAGPAWIAYRGRHRWEGEMAPLATGATGLPEGGSHLVLFDGDGEAGLAVAEALAAGSRLALAGRLDLPPRHRWETWQAAEGEALAALAGELPADGGSPRGPRGIRSLPAPEEIERLESEVAARCERAALSQDREMAAGLDLLCALHVRDYFTARGIAMLPGERLSHAGLTARLGIPPGLASFQRLFLRVLEAAGALCRDADGVTFLPGLTGDAAVVAGQLQAGHPDFGGVVRLLAHCVESYPAVFSGRVAPNAVLYPEGRFDMLRELLGEAGPTTRREVYRDLLAAVIGRLDEGRPLRILEVGAGTGVLTRPVLAALGGRPVHYHVTDIGRSFVREAEEWAAASGLAGLTFSIFDVSRDPVAQGLEPWSFDLVLSLDVVQATADLAGSVGNLRRLLAPEGLLCLLQTLQGHAWQHMIYGLSPGWWSFEQDALRGEAPTLSSEAWEAVLRGCGLAEVTMFPRTAEGRQRAAFALLLARQPAELAEPEYLAVRAREAVRRTERARGRVRQLAALERAGTELDVLDVPEEVGAPGLEQIVHWATARFGQLAGIFQILSATGGCNPFASGALACRSAAILERLEALERAKGDGSPVRSVVIALQAAAGGAAARVLAAAGERLAAAWSQSRRSTAADERWSCLSVATLEQGALRPALEALWGSGEPWATLPGAAPAAEPPAGPETSAVASRPASDFVGEVEEQVGAVWSELLGVDDLSRHDNFFDRGGDSLVALQVISRLRQIYGFDVAIRELFGRQTVAELAALLPTLTAGGGTATPGGGEPRIAAAPRAEESLDHLLAELEGISDEEVRALLERTGDNA